MIDDFHKIEPYCLSKEEKKKLLTKELLELTEYHRENCKAYERMLSALGYHKSDVDSYEDIPFLPVRLFKELELKSITEEKIFKLMTSSGTTGQAVSKIYVDKETAVLQQKVMIRLLNDFVGKQRLPMLIIDTPAVMKDRKQFSARGAAILGLNILAKKQEFVLNDDMTVNHERLEAFLEKYQGEKIIIFGFTFMLWQHFYQELKKSDRHYDLSKAYLLQSGGWKKLQSEAVSRQDFKKAFTDICGIKHFVDHYGMVEQTGCIYAECEYGHLHASVYSDVLIRNPKDFSLCKIGERGLIQVVSVLPHSYPGHSLITEDEGIILGEDDCPCGRKGKYIEVIGRVKDAELRGCSDTYAAEF